MVIICSPLPKNNYTLHLPFFSGNYPIVLPDYIYEWFYKYINWFTGIILFMVVYVIRKIGVTRILQILSR